MFQQPNFYIIKTRKDSEGDEVPRKGDRPGKGKYVCLYCGTAIELTEEEGELPACSECGNFIFY